MNKLLVLNLFWTIFYTLERCLYAYKTKLACCWQQQDPPHSGDRSFNNSGDAAHSSRPTTVELSIWPSWAIALLLSCCWLWRFWTWSSGAHRVSSSISCYWRFGDFWSSAFAAGTFNMGRWFGGGNFTRLPLGKFWHSVRLENVNSLGRESCFYSFLVSLH